MAALALTGSLLFLFVFWEITAFCSYALISFHNDDPKAVRGGIKALIMTQVGGIGLLAGALLAYTYTGDFQINSLLAQASELPAPVLTGIAFGCLIAAAAKSAQIPFHTWLPDAMEAPTPVSALIHAATMVNAGVYLLARFAPPLRLCPTGTRPSSPSVCSPPLGSGGNGDLRQRLETHARLFDRQPTWLHGLRHRRGRSVCQPVSPAQPRPIQGPALPGRGRYHPHAGHAHIRAMGGLGKQMPFVRNVFLVGALALAGVPPLNGFWSKELILESGFAYGPLWAYVGMLASAGLTALYTARALRLVFFGNPNRGRPSMMPRLAMRVSLGILTVATATVWLLAGPLSELLASTLPFHQVHPVTLASMRAAIS